jgi:hypothetical protein
VNINKSKAMVFHSRSAPPPTFEVTFEGHPLPTVSEFRYLGVKLNSHADMAHAASSGSVGLHLAAQRTLRLAAQEGVSHSPLAILHLFRNFVLPHVMYGCQLWGSLFLRTASHSDSCDNKLQRDSTFFTFDVCLVVGGSRPISCSMSWLSLHFNSTGSELSFASITSFHLRTALFYLRWRQRMPLFLSHNMALGLTNFALLCLNLTVYGLMTLLSLSKPVACITRLMRRLSCRLG